MVLDNLRLVWHLFSLKEHYT
uniref:Uncharacterized protein n=1 Tax=Arundo donax TaxID=35708 RepID=A0A0A8ZBV4_ARUDO